MDIFKQKRYLWLAIIVLVLMNLTALTVLWLGRPEGRRPQGGPQGPAADKPRIQQMLKKELGFDEIQVEQYLILRENHHTEAQQLEVEIRELKRVMFDEVLQEYPQPMLSDSLLSLVQTKQANLEQLTFQHFLDLKQLCKPEQQDKLKILMHEVFRQGKQPARKSDGPPPMPGDRQQPPRRPHPRGEEPPTPPRK